MRQCVSSTKQNKHRLPQSEKSHQLENYSNQAKILNEQPSLVMADLAREILHRSIGGLTFQDQDKNIYGATAFIISKHIILTAAHNIFDKKSGRQNTNFKFYLAKNGISESYFQLQGWKYPQEFENCQQNERLKFDYAIMKLKRPILFDEYLSLSSVCIDCLNKNKSSLELKIYGFPCAPTAIAGDLSKIVRYYQQNFKALNNQRKKQSLTFYLFGMNIFQEFEYKGYIFNVGEIISSNQYGLTRQNKIVIVDGNECKIGNAISTFPGQSGCPVAIGKRIIAVHVGANQPIAKFNVGRIINYDLLQNIMIWEKQLGAQELSIEREKSCEHQLYVIKSKNMSIQEKSLIEGKKEENSSNNKGKQIFQSKNSKKYYCFQDKKQSNGFESNIQPSIIVQDKNSRQLIKPNSIRTNRLFKQESSQFFIHNFQQNPYSNNEIKLNLSRRNLDYFQLKDYKNLLDLSLQSNKIAKIDLSSCRLLRNLNISKNKLCFIDIKDIVNLIQLNLSDNKIQKINIATNTNLTHLYLSTNQLSTIDVTKNINLTHLYLSENNLSKIDLSSNQNLTYLYLSLNMKNKLDVRNNFELLQLCLYSNRLTQMDLSKNIKLYRLGIWGNKLAHICLVVSQKATEMDCIKQFNISDQQSPVCQIHLICKEASSKGKAAQIASEWRHQYSRKKNNAHKCAYSFQII